MTSKNPKHVPLPTREQILEFIQESPGRVGKREIARAFNLDAGHRPFLRQIMKDMESDGLLQRGPRRKMIRPGALPEVTVVEVTGTNSDGDLIGRPLSWTEKDLPPPRIFVLPVRKGQPTVGIGDKVLCKVVATGDNIYDGRVVKKLGEGAARVLGILEVGVNGTYLRATNRRDKQDYVVARGDLGGAEPGALVEAEILPGRAYGLRQARVVDVLGDMSNPRSVSLIAIHANDIPTDFPQDALEQAAESKAAPMGKRVDLRDIPLVTIDGEDARDFDDAVWAEADGDGWHAIVAIADVAHYVRPGDALDTSAFERGNSVYFPDRVVPMLPEALSNGWCSLVPKEDRPCMAVRMWFDGQGRKHKHEFVRGMMRSVARLTYTQVQAAVDGAPDDTTGPLVDPLLTPLYGVYRALREARDRRGALEIELPERKVIIAEDGSVAGVESRPRYDSHMLIEELMIAANVCAAETLEAVNKPCMYRVHDEPALERLDSLREFLQSMDLNLARGAISPHHFNHILAKVKGTTYEHLVNQIVLRSQAQAIYSPENRGHFGLGLRRYAHFTSPIRRYSDLLVHRGLIAGLKLGSDGLPPDQGPEQFASMGEHISMTERRAATAEREAIDRFTATFLADRVGATFSGRVTGVNRFGLFVELDDSGANGLIPISTLPKDYYVHDEAHHALIGSTNREVHRLGDAITVKLREADAATGGMIFEFLETIGKSSADAADIGGRLAAAVRAKGGFRPPKRKVGDRNGAKARSGGGRGKGRR